MKSIKDITVDPKRNRVTLRFVERDHRGTVVARQQITISKREFESALRTAEMTIPWQDVRS